MSLILKVGFLTPLKFCLIHPNLGPDNEEGYGTPQIAEFRPERVSPLSWPWYCPTSRKGRYPPHRSNTQISSGLKTFQCLFLPLKEKIWFPRHMLTHSKSRFTNCHCKCSPTKHVENF